MSDSNGPKSSTLVEFLYDFVGYVGCSLASTYALGWLGHKVAATGGMIVGGVLGAGIATILDGAVLDKLSHFFLNPSVELV